MKRFVVFYHKYFDAKGGFLDYVDEFDTVLEARRFTRTLLPPKSPTHQQHMDGWWQIVDMEERRIYLNTGSTFSFPNDGKFGKRTLKDNLKKII